MERGLNRGFTLIELLVVIAIIAILAAILFPIFVAAKESGKRAYCQSNLKQLAMATLKYADDYDGTLPPSSILGKSINKEVIRRYLGTAVSDKTNVGILGCPARQIYVYNGWAMGPLSDTPTGFMGNEGYDHYADVKCTKGPIGRKYSSIAIASRMPMLWDAVYVRHGATLEEFLGFGWDIKDAFDPRRMTNLHNNGANYGFCDGHVKWYRAAGAPIYIQYVGLDFDGDGRVGTPDKIR